MDRRSPKNGAKEWSRIFSTESFPINSEANVQTGVLTDQTVLRNRLIFPKEKQSYRKQTDSPAKSQPPVKIVIRTFQKEIPERNLMFRNHVFGS
jgi:hypothetical protein